MSLLGTPLNGHIMGNNLLVPTKKFALQSKAVNAGKSHIWHVQPMYSH